MAVEDKKLRGPMTDYSKNVQEDLSKALAEASAACDRYWLPADKLDSIWMTKSKDNMLHLAAIHGKEDLFKEIVQFIRRKASSQEACVRILSAQNKRGETALHLAAARGSWRICELILAEDRYFPLVHIRNNRLETPLFSAALHGNKEAFDILQRASDQCRRSMPSPSKSGIPWRREGGETMLHCTLEREHFELSFPIIRLYKDEKIAAAFDERGETPLHVLAKKPSAFKSGTNFEWWQNLLYKCAIVEQPQEAPVGEPVLPHHCHKFSVMKVLKSSYMYVFGLLDITETKKKYVWSSRIMEEIVLQCLNLRGFADGSNPSDLDPVYERKEISSMMNDKLESAPSSFNEKDMNQDQRIQNVIGRKLLEVLEKLQVDADKPNNCISITWKKDNEEKWETMTVLLTAAQYGILEMVKTILNKVPAAVHEINRDGKNVFLVAAEHRQPHIIRLLEDTDVWESLIQVTDKGNNNILHLAAKMPPKHEACLISSPAVQMQWEVAWYEFVEKAVPRHLIFQSNNEGAMPDEIFTESRKDLEKEAIQWLKSTLESCSVVAALIASVSFPTSSSVPGGTNDQTGKPTLEGQQGFHIYTITSFLAFCFSVIALVMFLSIFTSKKQPRDYKRKLPLKLLLGLTSLLVAIGSMLISFCAAYFSMIKGNNILNKKIAIIFVATSFPVLSYAGEQIQSYWDLFKAATTRVPQRPIHRKW